MNTKELILQTAINLFNQLGTARVTTNLIASEAEISPGNLYYYYKDKSHIIRKIYIQMMQEWEKVYEQVEGDAMLEKTLTKFIELNFELLWRYRFFYRETVALLNADEILSKLHIDVSKARFDRQRKILQKAEKDGLLHFAEPETEIDDVLTIAWIVANHYLVYLESMGHQVEKIDFTTGIQLVMKVLSPYQVRLPV